MDFHFWNNDTLIAHFDISIFIIMLHTAHVKMHLVSGFQPVERALLGGRPIVLRRARTSVSRILFAKITQHF